MKVYNTDNLRNVAMVGHSGAGKTNLAEAMLFQSGATKQMGNVSKNNTFSDFSEEEKKRQSSIGTSIIPIEWRDKKINLIDAPGYMDFVGEVYAALRAAESAMIVIDATSGIQVGTELVWKYCEDIDLPRIIFVNKIDGENVNFRKLMDEIEAKFGKKVVPFSTPIGEAENFEGVTDIIFQKGFSYENGTPTEIELNHDQFKATERIYEEIAELVAESDDDLMEKYFADEKFTREDLLRGVTSAIVEGRAVPVLVGSGEKNIGIDILLNMIVNYMPAPNNELAHHGFRPKDGKVMPELDNKEDFTAMVFKTIPDPFVGRISIFNVTSGTYKKGQEIYNISKGITQKPGGLFVVRGKDLIEVDEIHAGDIGAFTRLDDTKTNDTIACKELDNVEFKPIKTPQANLFFAIEPVSKDDEDKISSGLARIQEEDPSFVINRNAETNQLTIGGQGAVQLQTIMDKLKNQYKVEVKKVPLIIPYRETITQSVEVQGKHRKQSGGAGQYGDVWIRFEPCDEEFVFDEEIFGGAVPRGYFPAVEKGLEEARVSGVLAGYPTVNFKATLYDGSYHDVDSNEMAFKLAAALAYREGIPQAGPILLEPIMDVEITIPDEYLGDVMGDMNKRRGRILGMDQLADGSQLLIAEAPQQEMFEYAIDLRQMTQARGSFTMDFARYEQAPQDVTEEVIAQRRKED